jgi:hypothetical protein
MDMTPGFVVIRIPKKGSRWIVESRIFRTDDPEFDRGWVLGHAERWRDHIQGQHPKDEVFIVESLPAKVS